MTSYGRDYSAPIFHIADADSVKIDLMQTVFSTLEASGIDFVEVQRVDDSKEAVNVIMHGDFTQSETEDILEEIEEIYLRLWGR